MPNKILITTILSTSILLGTSVALAADKNFNGSKESNIASYVIGYNMGYYYNELNASEGTLINPDMIGKGLKDGLSKKKPNYSQDEMKNAMVSLQQAVQDNQVLKIKQIATNNLKASDEYLAKIAKMNDVHTIQKGLYYKIVTSGDGKKPTLQDYVTINYQASLSNGTIVYDTFASGRSETFLLNQAILGWQQAIKQMPTGSVWMVYIAPSLAYGENAPLTIGPNQALTYKIQLLSINPATR